jgi:hypothetical protein
MRTAKGVSGRECARRLGISEASVRNDRRDGCPAFADGSYDPEAVQRWRAMNRGESRNKWGTAERAESFGAQFAPLGAHDAHDAHRPDDDCGLEPDPCLTVADGALFYALRHADADLVMLSELLQERLPELLRCSAEAAEVLRRAIRRTICTWTGSEACPHCRRAIGIIDPPEPPGDDDPAPRASRRRKRRALAGNA